MATRLAAQLLTPSPTMADLPEDIQLEIFSWLPGKQVASLRTLSKHTCAGIRSQNFHLSQARRANTDAGFFVRDMNGQFRLFFTDGSAGVAPSSLDFLNESRIQIVGSNEGLVVCLQEDGHLFIYNPLRKDTLLLGRPATQTSECAAPPCFAEMTSSLCSPIWTEKRELLHIPKGRDGAA